MPHTVSAILQVSYAVAAKVFVRFETSSDYAYSSNNPENAGSANFLEISPRPCTARISDLAERRSQTLHTVHHSVIEKRCQLAWNSVLVSHPRGWAETVTKTVRTKFFKGRRKMKFHSRDGIQNVKRKVLVGA